MSFVLVKIATFFCVNTTRVEPLHVVLYKCLHDENLLVSYQQFAATGTGLTLDVLT